MSETFTLVFTPPHPLSFLIPYPLFFLWKNFVIVPIPSMGPRKIFQGSGRDSAAAVLRPTASVHPPLSPDFAIILDFLLLLPLLSPSPGIKAIASLYLGLWPLLATALFDYHPLYLVLSTFVFITRDTWRISIS